MENDVIRMTSSVITLASTDATPKIATPDPTGTHFYTAGRMLSYSIPNRNGLVFFREDCQPVLNTLKTSLANLAHIKPGNDAADPYKINNGVIGAIQDYVEDEEGIDILCKNDKTAVKSMGFKIEDLSPEGQFASFSQESDFSPSTSPFITVPPSKVNYITPADIVDEISYPEAIAKGLKTSYYNPITGRWNYAYDDKGNAIFIRMRPLSFAGVGHVVKPADRTAQIYSYAAALDGEKAISALYPRADDPEAAPEPPDDFFGSNYADDFIKNPDLLTAIDKSFSVEEGGPDEHYAAVWHSMPQNLTDKPEKQRAFKVKDDAGRFQRDRLIAAYHSLSGMRGDTVTAKTMPRAVAAHAMALVRQGLDQTKSKKELSSMNASELTPGINAELEELKERAKTLSTEKSGVESERDTFKSQLENTQRELSELRTAKEELVNELKTQLSDKDTEIETLKGQLAEHANKALSSERLAKLESIHPFSAEEKADEEKFSEFVKSLSSISEDRLETLAVRRELEKTKAERAAGNNKTLSSLRGEDGSLSPVPSFDPTNGQTKLLEIKSPADIF